MASLSSSNSKPHIVIFPFMAKGHTIPLLHLAQLLLDRGVTITIFTTPQNHLFISQSLPTNDVSIVDLPFPENIPGIPPGIENTEKLPSMSLFSSFASATKPMQPYFEEELEKVHSQVSCIISDGFLPWTLESASRFGIPRLCFFGMGYYATALNRETYSKGLLSLHASSDQPFKLTRFPWIELTRNHFSGDFNKHDSDHSVFFAEVVASRAKSYGLLMNSFYELEQVYADYCNNESQPKTWGIGPLCLTKLKRNTFSNPKWMHWLDQKMAQNYPVLYVAFGSQAQVSPTQLQEIAIGLKESKVSFFWVIKSNQTELLSDDFEDETRERGIIVSEWVDQEEILEHPIVQGFLSHCGWNSVLDGICAEVPILAWPMFAEQWLNAKMVVEEIKVGLRVSTVDGSEKGFVTADSLKTAVTELMDGEKGKQLRETVKEVAAAARQAVAEGGSSWHALNNLLGDINRQKEVNNS